MIALRLITLVSTLFLAASLQAATLQPGHEPRICSQIAKGRPVSQLISELEMPASIFHLLRDAGISFVSDLSRYSTSDLIDEVGLSGSEVADLIQALAVNGQDGYLYRRAPYRRGIHYIENEFGDDNVRAPSFGRIP